MREVGPPADDAAAHGQERREVVVVTRFGGLGERVAVDVESPKETSLGDRGRRPRQYGRALRVGRRTTYLPRPS